jgi:hypothetical protein
MSPKLASVGFSTAAEAAWFEQEVHPDAGFLERPTSQRRMLIVFAAAFLVIGSVLGVARATARGPQGPQPAAAAIVAPAPLAAKASKPAVAAKSAKPAAAKAKSATKVARAKRGVRGKSPAKAAPRGKSGRTVRHARHR